MKPRPTELQREGYKESPAPLGTCLSPPLALVPGVISGFLWFSLGLVWFWFLGDCVIFQQMIPFPSCISQVRVLISP